MSIIDKRRGGKGARNGLVEYSIEAKSEIKAIFEEADLPTPAFNQLKKNNKQSIDTFKNAIAKAKQSLGNNGASVELKDDYTDINLYLSEDGESGFGIKPNGDIVSVFSSKNAESGRSHYMLEMATAEGGRQLDCFDIYLTKIYEAHGFKPVAKMKWNDEYIPDGWNKDNFKDYNNGEPDVVFMVYDPEGKLEKKKEEYKARGEEWKPIEVYDYDDGETFQHIHKWRSPAEREAIYNNMLEKYKNAKTSEELKKTVFDNDAPLDDFNRLFNDLNSLNKEQKQGIKDEYDKRMLELLKEEDPEQYKAHKKYLEQKAKEKAKKEKEKTKADARIDTQHAGRSLQNYIDNAIQTPFINDLLILAEAEKEFDESKIKRDKNGRFAKKNSSGSDTDNDKIKDNTKDTDNDNDNIKEKIKQAEYDIRTSEEQKINNPQFSRLYDRKINEAKKVLEELKKQMPENPKALKSNFKIGDKTDLGCEVTGDLKATLINQNDYYDLFNTGKPLSAYQQTLYSNAIDLLQDKYEELFNIYGIKGGEAKNKNIEDYDKQKIKVVLIEKADKRAKGYGFVLVKDETNTIYLNKKLIDKDFADAHINEIILHEMHHLIQNYNHNHNKGQYRSVYFEELLSESATLLMGKELYRKPADSKQAVNNIYNFGCNFANWLYNKSGKSMNIFKDMRDSKASSGIKAIVESANKNGIEGNFNDMVKEWLKEQFNISDSETSEHLLILERALNKNSRIVGGI